MNKAIFYLTTSTLIVQTEKSVLSRIDFADFIEGKTIKDADAFELYLKDALQTTAKKAELGIIVLGSGLLYQKAVEKDADLERAQEELLETVTFPKEDIQEKKIETPAKIYLLVTNKSFYQAVVRVCHDFGIDIQAVLPLSLFSDEAEKELSKQEVRTILEREQLYDSGNFIQIDEGNDKGVQADEEVSEKEALSKRENGDMPIDSQKELSPFEKVSVWNTSRLLVILGFLIVLSALLGGLIYLQQTHHYNFLMPSQPTPTPTAAPTPTAIPQETAKADLSIEVQNGTGTPGQAAKAKGLLEGIEYTNITVGNADSTDHDKTEIVFSDKVSAPQQQEIKSLFLKYFTAVTTSIDKSPTKDVVITTGSEK